MTINLSEHTSFKDFVEDYLPIEITTSTFDNLDYMIHRQDTADDYEVFIFTDNVNGRINIAEDVYYYDDNLIGAISEALYKSSYHYNFEEGTKIYMDEDIFEMMTEEFDDNEYLVRDICNAWDIKIEDED
tara:strand:+ start:223 stop:612 length:390 start_codon:yes stop_codon:yes gene_type:complete